MAASIIVPFDWSGATTTIKTSSYTPAAGKRAYCIPKNWDCQLNGINVALVSGEDVVNSVALSTGLYFLGMIPQNGTVVFDYARTSGAQTARLAILMNNGTTDEAVYLTAAGSSGSFRFSYGVAAAAASLTSTLGLVTTGATLGANHSGAAVYLEVTNSGSDWRVTNAIYEYGKQGFWITSADTITGSRWIVSEFNNYS